MVSKEKKDPLFRHNTDIQVPRIKYLFCRSHPDGIILVFHGFFLSSEKTTLACPLSHGKLTRSISLH